MPDAGDMTRDLPDGADLRWDDAFAHLPQATPDADAWRRVQARMPAAAQAIHRRWPRRFAIAAALALVAAIPWRLTPRVVSDAGPASPIDTPIAIAPAATVPTPKATAGAPSSPPATSPAVRAIPARAVATDARRASAGSTASRRATAAPVHGEDATRVPATIDALEPLYAQSAQLEALLAVARDERVSSGPAAALSGELDATVAAIDGALIQPGLADAQRTELWKRRIDALQQLLGIEATNRLYAARGQTYDAALVSID